MAVAETYIDVRLDELEKRMELRFEALARQIVAETKSNADALQLSSHALEKRLETMNQFREQIKEERSLLLPRSEFTLQHDRLLDDVRGLRESRAMLEGKASQGAFVITLILAVIGIGLSVVSIFLH